MTKVAVLEPTQYEAQADGFHYTVTKVKSNWVVLRRRCEDAPIPPLTQFLNKNGWVPILSNEAILANRALFTTAHTAIMEAVATR